MIPVAPKSLLAMPANDIWKQHRRIMGPSMHRRYLSRMAHHIAAVADALVGVWNSKMDLANGSSFSVRPEIKLATMEAITTMLTGKGQGSLDLVLSSMRSETSEKPGVVDFLDPPQPPLVEAFRIVMAGANLGRQLPFRSFTIPILLWFYPGWTKAHSLIYAYLEDALDSSIEQENTVANQNSLLTDADCMVDMVVQQERREGVDKLDRKEILDELCQYVLAGQESTAAALMWFVKFMPKDMELQRLLHEEVCSQLTDPGSIPLEVVEDVERMPVLEAVLTETLRCARVASGVIRHTVTDLVILGTHIPKGTDIMIPTGPIAKSEAVWGPDAKTWRPTRWLRPDGSFNPDAGYAGHPFGMGHRICFGQRFAISEMKIFFATLSRAFIFKSVAPAVDSWDSGAEVANLPKECYVSLQRWES